MPGDDDQPRVTRATRDAEARDARAPHLAGDVDDDAAADAPTGVDERVRDAEREMTERGAHQQGEGRVP
ncbi:MAG TPA: hypothetical protein VFA84_16030 [Acidimicrobiales bacterium]|nr:hypothetical protein [Acidimicrobiales bacterium]